MKLKTYICKSESQDIPILQWDLNMQNKEISNKKDLKFCDGRASPSLKDGERKARKNSWSVASGMKFSFQNLLGVKVELTRSSKTPA